MSDPTHHEEKINREIIRYRGRKTNASAREIPYRIDE
jgi:hypothetical protein